MARPSAKRRFAAAARRARTGVGERRAGGAAGSAGRALVAAGLHRDRLMSTVTAKRQRDELATVERYAMFVGYPRSGHSLLGSLLNAHPEMLVAHQLHALRYVQAGFSREQLYGMILRADARFGRKGRMGTRHEYDYSVPGQWQGRVSTLRVIGDKRGMTSAQLLGVHPELLTRLGEVVRVPVHLIHVTRNPFDNIATMSRRTNTPLEKAAGRYFDAATTIASLRQAVAGDRWFELRHEDLVADPRRALRDLCRFLHVTEDDSYIEAAASVVFDSPRRTRDAAGWTPALRESVAERIAAVPFLADYRFDEPVAGR